MGAVWLTTTTLSLVGCQIVDNSASGGAGGVSSYGTLTVDRCTISGNSSGGSGDNGGAGGIESDINELTLVDSVISGNTCWSYGGGINVEGGYATIEGCQIRDNVAYDAGGGLTVIRNPSPLVHNGTIIVRDCDFLYNAAGEYGGGAVLRFGLHLRIARKRPRFPRSARSPATRRGSTAAASLSPPAR